MVLSQTKRKKGEHGLDKKAESLPYDVGGCKGSEYVHLFRNRQSLTSIGPLV